MRYPTEAKFGVGGYRRVAGAGLSTGPSPKPVQPFRPPTPGGRTIRPPRFPANDPRYVTTRRVVGRGVGRLLGPIVGGFLLGWEIGVYLFGDPFGAPAPEYGYDPYSFWVPPVRANVHWEYFQCPAFGSKTPTHWRGVGNVLPSDCGTMPGGFQTVVHSAEPPAAWIYPGSTLPFPGAVNGWYAYNSALPATMLYGFTAIIDGSNPWTPADAYYYDPDAGGSGAVVIPEIYPATAPELAPIGWPSVPIPAPWGDALPQPGTQPSADPLTEPWVEPVVLPLPMPGFPPVVLVPPTVVNPDTGLPEAPGIPSVIITPVPGGVTVQPAPPTDPTDRDPPDRDTRDWKGYTNLPGWASTVRIVVNTGTEALDFINALYAGVPRELRTCRPGDFTCRLRAIWEAMDDPNYSEAEAIERYLNDQFMDFVWGMLGQQIGRASRNLNILTGLNRAIREGNDNIYQWMLDNGVEPTSLFPQLVHNSTTNEWFFEWELFGISVPAPTN